MSQADKKFYIDQTIKVGLVLFGAYTLKQALTFSKPGRVDRIPFDLEKTQNRYFVTDSSTDPPTVETIPDPWNPADLSRRLYSALNGISMSTGTRIDLFNELQRLGLDRARWLHNYWLAQIDPKDTVYRWINNEWGVHASKQDILADLRRWGIGF